MHTGSSSDAGLDFGLLPMTSAIIFTINLIVLLSSLRKPVHSLFLILFPLAALILALTLLIGSSAPLRETVSLPIGAHIFFSIVAYSLLTIAAFQAIFIALQNWRLRHETPRQLATDSPSFANHGSIAV